MWMNKHERMNSKKSLYHEGREEHEGKNGFISILLRARRGLRGSLSKNPGTDGTGLAWISFALAASCLSKLPNTRARHPPTGDRRGYSEPASRRAFTGCDQFVCPFCDPSRLWMRFIESITTTSCPFRSFSQKRPLFGFFDCGSISLQGIIVKCLVSKMRLIKQNQYGFSTNVFATRVVIL